MSYTRIFPTVGIESLRFRQSRFWCLRSESNQRHADFQSAALPTELQRHVEQRCSAQNTQMRILLATRNGLEPSTSSVTGWRANRLHHRAKFGGGNNRARTCDPMLVRHVLSQLSYAPLYLPLLGFPQRRGSLYTVNPYLSSCFFNFFPQIFPYPKAGKARFWNMKIIFFQAVREYPPGQTGRRYRRTGTPPETVFLPAQSQPIPFCPG